MSVISRTGPRSGKSANGPQADAIGRGWRTAATGPVADWLLLAGKRGNKSFTLLWQPSWMARHHSARHFKPHRQRRPKGTETTFETAKRYGFIAVASGLGIAFGANASDDAQKRQALLEALPPGYTYSGCDEVRAAGVAPIYSSERGFSDRLDGDGDGIGCEPHRGQ